jgi:hypothetical protein
LYVGVLALVWIAAVSLVRSRTPRSRPAAVSPASADLPAESFAVGFTRAFLTYSASSPGGHERQLAPYLGDSSSLDGDAGMQLPSQGSDQVQFAQVAASHPGSGGTTYVVQAATTADGTVYLAVTVATGSSGAVNLVGEPALVGAPALAAAAASPSDAGQQVTDAGLTGVVDRALTNFLEGKAGDLQSDLPNGVSIATPTTVLGQIQVGQIDWLTQGRSVGVDVQATDRAGAQFDLKYTVGGTRQPVPGGARWFVTGIQTTR